MMEVILRRIFAGVVYTPQINGDLFFLHMHTSSISPCHTVYTFNQRKAGIQSKPMALKEANSVI